MSRVNRKSRKILLIVLIITGSLIQEKMTEAKGSRGGLFGAGGRFKGGTDPVMEKFNESLSFDKRYVYYNIIY